MTSAQNPLQLLSGNKKLAWWLATCLIINACSPKVQPTVKNKPRPQIPATEVPSKAPAAPVTKPTAKEAVAKTSTIAMLLPLNLDELNSVKGYNSSDLKKANIAIDYYQGFKLALDSLTARGYNFKLQLFDTKDQPGYAHSLASNPAIRNSNLIVGPVFPDGIKSFTSSAIGIKKPLLSPLAPASPTDFNNPYLITANPPLEYHAMGAAHFVTSRLKPRKIFIIKSGFSEDNKYIVPFKKAIDSLSRKKIQVVYFTLSKGSFTALLPQMNNKVENVFIVPSVNQAFLMMAMRSMDTLAVHYPITVIGHPSWEKFSFLRTETLQRLKTHITSAERVNYKASATVAFIKAYRQNFNSEPNTYAYKGFDEGMYFGEVLAMEGDEMAKLDKHDYQALHNSFHFVKKPGLGWVNTHVNVLKYVNFELKQVQ